MPRNEPKTKFETIRVRKPTRAKLRVFKDEKKWSCADTVEMAIGLLAEREKLDLSPVRRRRAVSA